MSVWRLMIQRCLLQNVLRADTSGEPCFTFLARGLPYSSAANEGGRMKQPNTKLQV